MDRMINVNWNRHALGHLLPKLVGIVVAVMVMLLAPSAKTAEENVTTVLERQINGTEQVVYMSSQTTNNGTTTINVSFPVEIDRNTAQVLVQNHVAVAEASLPTVVNQTGVTTQKPSPTITLVYSIASEKDADEGSPKDVRMEVVLTKRLVLLS